MPHSSIWLLVTDEQTARIYESREGCSRLVRAVENAAMPAAGKLPRGGNVVPLHGPASVPATPRDRNRDFAFQLTVVLLEAAESRACDGIIVAATKDMLEALRRVRPLTVSRLLIAEIVEGADTVPSHTENSNTVVKLALTASAPTRDCNVAVSASDAFDELPFADTRRG